MNVKFLPKLVLYDVTPLAGILVPFTGGTPLPSPVGAVVRKTPPLPGWIVLAGITVATPKGITLRGTKVMLANSRSRFANRLLTPFAGHGGITTLPISCEFTRVETGIARATAKNEFSFNLRGVLDDLLFTKGTVIGSLSARNVAGIVFTFPPFSKPTPKARSALTEMVLVGFHRRGRKLNRRTAIIAMNYNALDPSVMLLARLATLPVGRAFANSILARPFATTRLATKVMAAAFHLAGKAAKRFAAVFTLGFHFPTTPKVVVFTRPRAGYAHPFHMTLLVAEMVLGMSKLIRRTIQRLSALRASCVGFFHVSPNKHPAGPCRLVVQTNRGQRDELMSIRPTSVCLDAGILSQFLKSVKSGREAIP